MFFMDYSSSFPVWNQNRVDHVFYDNLLSLDGYTKIGMHQLMSILSDGNTSQRVAMWEIQAPVQFNDNQVMGLLNV